MGAHCFVPIDRYVIPCRYHDLMADINDAKTAKTDTSAATMGQPPPPPPPPDTATPAAPAPPPAAGPAAAVASTLPSLSAEQQLGLIGGQFRPSTKFYLSTPQIRRSILTQYRTDNETAKPPRCLPPGM